MDDRKWLGHPGDKEGRCVAGVWAGIRPDMEERADEIIFSQTTAQTRPSEKADVLTRWKMGERYSREISMAGGTEAWGDGSAPGAMTRTSDGTPDRAFREGVFSRRINPVRGVLNGNVRGVRAGDSKEFVGTVGSGPVFGIALNTPSVWADGDPSIPTSSTGCSGKVSVRRIGG